MNPGRLKDRVTLIDYDIAVNEFGEEEKTEKEIATFWADARPISAREFFKNGLNYEEVYTFLIRKTEINPKQLIKYNNKKYEIIGIEDFRGEHKYLLITAKALNEY